MKNPHLAAGSFYQHGWQSWNVAAWRPPETPLRYPVVPAHQLQSTDPAHLFDEFPGGATLGAIAHGDGTITLKGGIEMDTWVSHTPNGLRGTGSESWFDQTGCEEQVFAEYAAALKARFGARTSQAGSVWCSWYSFYNNVTELGMHKVLDGLSSGFAGACCG